MPDVAPRTRAFIAVPLPDTLKQELASLQQQLRHAVPELRPARPENLHLTLHFLGDQPQERLADIGRSMLSIGQKKGSFNVSLEGLGCFPNLRRPRVLWLGLKPAEPVVEIYRALATILEGLGVEVDRRPYRPHLTLGRFKSPPQHPERVRPFMTHRCSSLQIDRVVLFSSTLSAGGAIHRPLQTVGLAGPGA